MADGGEDAAPGPPRTTIAELNACDRPRFLALLGWVFEHSPWVADRALARRPFRDVADLHDAMTSEVARATREEQLALLRAHPDLGARARMSPASRGEQAGAGLDSATADVVQRLERLNASYRERFGFPFLQAVKGSTTEAILEALERRLTRSAAEEFDEALRQVGRIARVRLGETVRQ
jgi:2-oxo-4-hydroxy-4-carboxy-5-ureidoimidazoline decarboxylase